ncbi:thiamine phosphate synthase [Silvibacterium sp.]|uniref:thiamine phosphate synthase n=1 Tax=Silvibacterium sp. TaxID=1964179 RepID=UPI0039E691CC
MILCAITDRRIFPGTEGDRRRALLAAVQAWAEGGVDFIQLREKDLHAREMLALAGEVTRAASGRRNRPRVLLNGPAEIALAAGCDGVHLPGNAAPDAATSARALFAAQGRKAVISRSCHVGDETASGIASWDADLLLFAPVFEKSLSSDGGGTLAGSGPDALAAACWAASPRPVLALGGVTLGNVPACMAAGAAGVAAIRLFAVGDWRRLRG